MAPDLVSKEKMGKPVDVHIRCVNNYEADFSEIEDSLPKKAEQSNKFDHLEVSMEHMHPFENPVVEIKSEGATESSSSFGNTASGEEDDAMLSDPEVVSKFCGDATSSVENDKSGEAFRPRKKKLTSHWREYIRPHKWRCKWLELQIMRLQSQALKYDSQLEKIDQRKKFNSKDCTVEDGTKSLPFHSATQREKVMKRKKRKNVEHTIDKTAYMAQHNLFSYFENRRPTNDLCSIDIDWGNLDKKIRTNRAFEIVDEPKILLGFNDDETPLEQILRKVLNRVEHVTELKTRLKNVMRKNAESILFAEELSLLEPSDALTGSTSPNNRDKVLPESSCTASQLTPEKNMDNLVVTEGAISKDADPHCSDIDESKDQPQSQSKTSGNELTCNHVAQELEQDKSDEATTKISLVPVVDEMLIDDKRTTEETSSVPKVTKLPKNKSKRGRRKSRRWRR